jgi:hypothetical protein
MFKKESEAKILEWIKANRLDLFGKYLVSGTIHGKPGIPVAELARIGKILRKYLSDKDLYDLGKTLLKRKEYTSRRIGASLVSYGWPKKRDVEDLIRLAADDEDWQVRETAAGVFADLLEKDFGHFSKLFQKWIHHDNKNIKRAIALAVKYDSKAEDPKKWMTYFKLIDPLMSEPSEYVRKNLGPFAIGDGLLARFPRETLDACKKWALDKDENVKWNTAMIFTSAAARNFSKEGKKILDILVLDKSTFVSKAARKALKKIS